MARMIPTPIDHCEDCWFVIDRPLKKNANNVGCYCKKEKRFLTEDEWENGKCPEWCPFPKHEE